jgi:hypothetical protein
LLLKLREALGRHPKPIRPVALTGCVQYSLIATGIAMAIIATVYGIGPKLNTTFSSVATQLK